MLKIVSGEKFLTPIILFFIRTDMEKKLKESNPDIMTVMMTGFRNEVKEALEKAQADSAVTCLYKPFDPSEAAELVHQIGKKSSHSWRIDES